MPSDAGPQGRGTIVTFYSYKGGTGRSMALANVGWLLASNGKRVLMVDWDLEAPGLHRFFHPLLLDSQLRSSRGLMDLVWDFALTAMTPAPDEQASAEWQSAHADVLQYAIGIDWSFRDGGCLHLVPAGRQDSSYATRVSAFDWQNFYDRLGGGAFLESVKSSMRATYDYALIDSRTGLSDTAGICTVQMPDVLVCCFTLSNQSIEGAAAVAQSVLQQRPDPSFRVLPVPMRVEDGEHRKLEAGRDYARSTFNPVLRDVTGEARERYWGEVEVPYRKYYAYEEVLATVADRPRVEGTVLAALERVAAHLTRGEVTAVVPVMEPERGRLLSRFERGAPSGERRDFFISYSHADRDWASWIAWALASEGYSVFLDIWDLSPGEEWPGRLGLALDRSERVIAVVSENYVSSSRAMAEAAAAVGGESRTAGRLIPVLVADVSPPPPLDAIQYLDLRGLTDEATARRLLLSGGAAGGLKPGITGTWSPPPAAAGPPAYPGARRSDRPAIPDDIPAADPAFVDREELLEAVGRGFEEAGGTRRDVVQVLAGMPGVGKTAVAIVFARRVRAAGRPVLWSRAEPLDLVALRVTLGGLSGRTGPERPQVVVDGAESPATLEKLDLARLGVDVLVTSRTGAWTGVRRVHRLPPLGGADAAALLQSATGDGDAEAALAVADALGRLPMALRLTADYVGETGRSLRSHRELLAAQPDALLARHLTPLTDSLRVELASVRERSPEAWFVLEALALLGPAPVPLSLVSISLPSPEDALALDEAVQVLHQRGLLTRADDQLVVSPLVQRVVSSQFGAPTMAHRVGLVLSMLAGLLGDPERRESWPLYAALSPHVRAAAAHAFRLAGLLDEVSIPIWTGLLARTGRYLLSAGDLRAAADALDRALELRTATTDPDTIAEVRADRVEVSRLLGRLAEARGRLEEWPEGAVDVAGLRDLALGTVLRDQGDLVAAREALRRVLTKLPPDGRWRRLASRCERELAVVVRLSGDDGARGLVERALEGHQRVLGSRHDEVGRDLRELGVVLREAAELDDARRTLEQALWVHRSLLGGGHHDIGRDLCELAAAVAEMGEREQARSLLDESLAILSGAFGEAHPEVARARRWLAVVTRADGDLAVAASMLHQVLAVLEAALGPVHPEVAQTLVEQARTLREMGDLAGARRAYQRALSIWDSVLGPGNPVSSAVSAETEVLSAVVRQEGRTT